MAVRLRQVIEKHSKLKLDEVVHILDSTCTLATFYKDTIALKEFMSNRCAEVLTKSKLHEWEHKREQGRARESKKNISDLLARDKTLVLKMSPKTASGNVGPLGCVSQGTSGQQ